MSTHSSQDEAERASADGPSTAASDAGPADGRARILILGGTTESRVLAAKLAERRDCAVTLSLAGRTAEPAPQPVPVRVGGFGGVEGLADYLAAEKIALLVDATHPFATRISVNATAAADRVGVPLVAIRRPAWRAVAGDRWTEVESVEAAVAALGETPRRVFLALGRQEITPFEAAPQHAYVVRSVDPVEPPLAVADATYLTARGPFDEAAEKALLAHHRIDAVVAKNSGGEASYGKIAAARALGIEVIVVRRPPAPPGTVATVEAALEAVDHRLASRSASATAAVARGE